MTLSRPTTKTADALPTHGPDGLRKIGRLAPNFRAPEPPLPTVFKVPPGSASRPMGAAEALAQPPPVARASILPALPQSAPPPMPTANRQRGIEIAQSYTKRRVPYAPPSVAPGAPAFRWPVGGTISSLFNISSSGKRLHNGIDIANKRGTPIQAAAAGRVLYSDNKYLPSMGNMAGTPKSHNGRGEIERTTDD